MPPKLNLGPDQAAGPPQFVGIAMNGGVMRATLVGPIIGQREGPIITAELVRAIEAAGPVLRLLVLDLSDVAGMASMGLGMCIEVRNRAWERGAPTVLYGLNPDLVNLIHLVKVQRLYTLAHSDEELAGLMAA
ncbi:MAG: STAS domain-containing protein [Phycisphaerales bacterium]|nr:MAG: STAS domain-containing protein [Phycisphaerales bacterium]